MPRIPAKPKPVKPATLTRRARVTRVGNSACVLLDRPMRNLLGADVGAEVDVEATAGKVTITRGAEGVEGAGRAEGVGR